MNDDAFGQICARLTKIEQRLTARLVEVGQTLTARMSNQFERVLNRLSAIEADLHRV